MARSLINGAEQIAAGTLTWAALVSGAIVPTASLVDGANFVKKDGSVTMTGSLNFGSLTAIALATPVNATDAANKAYVDAAMKGMTIHGMKWVSVANISALTGLSAVDGGTPADGDVVLLTAQTTQSQNGPWTMHSGSWTRPTWWASAATIPEGNYFIADPDGTTYKNTKWFCNTVGNIVVDTTNVTFVQDAGGTSYSNGNGLSLTGTTFAVKVGNGLAFDGSNNVTVTSYATRLCTTDANGVGITDGTAGQVVVANASNHASWQTLSGDVTITSGGVTSVNNTSGSGFTKYGNFINGEVPSGSINDSNTSFSLANTPVSGTVNLYVNGLLQQGGSGNDYTISGSTITMLFTPQTGDKLIATYMK